MTPKLRVRLRNIDPLDFPNADQREVSNYNYS